VRGANKNAPPISSGVLERKRSFAIKMDKVFELSKRERFDALPVQVGHAFGLQEMQLGKLHFIFAHAILAGQRSGLAGSLG
jgi:hypothetical protein